MNMNKKLLLPSLLALLMALFATEPSAQRIAASSHGQGYARSRDSLARVWVPGHYETRMERVWVPARCEEVWVPAVFEWRLDGCGRRVHLEVSAGHYETIHHPGHYESRPVKRYRPGYWALREACGRY